MQARNGIVFRHHVGSARAPLAIHFDPHPRVRDQVLDIERVPAVLGDDPESISVKTVPDRSLPRLASLSPMVSSSA